MALLSECCLGQMVQSPRTEGGSSVLLQTLPSILIPFYHQMNVSEGELFSCQQSNVECK